MGSLELVRPQARLAASITAWLARSTGQKISGRQRTEQPVFRSPQSERGVEGVESGVPAEPALAVV